MARKANPQAKSHDPNYIAARNRQVRQRHHAQVSIRIPDDTLAGWHSASTSHNQTLKDWMVDTLNHAVAETLQADKP